MRRSVIAFCVAVWAAGGSVLAATSISVMPLGDSITAGTVAGGYRKPMLNRLTSTYQLNVTTVGTQSDTTLPVGQQPHEGHGGWRIDQLADNLLGANNVGNDGTYHGGYWLKGGNGTGRGAINPGVVTVMAGINDINGFIGNDTSSPMSSRSALIMSTIEDRMTRLIGTLSSNLPNTTILMGGCIPYNNGLINDQLTGANTANRAAWAIQDGVSQDQEYGVNHWVVMFNKWIRDTYVPQARAAGAKVYYVNEYANFILSDGTVRGWDNTEPQNTNGPAGYGDYGLHLNQFGYNLMGQTWADAINLRTIPEPASLGVLGVAAVGLVTRRRRA